MASAGAADLDGITIIVIDISQGGSRQFGEQVVVTLFTHGDDRVVTM